MTDRIEAMGKDVHQPGVDAWQVAERTGAPLIDVDEIEREEREAKERYEKWQKVCYNLTHFMIKSTNKCVLKMV